MNVLRSCCERSEFCGAPNAARRAGFVDVILTSGFCQPALPHWHKKVALFVRSVERVAHEDREVSKSAPSDDSLSTLYSGSDRRYALLEFDDAALVLSCTAPRRASFFFGATCSRSISSAV